MNKKVNFEKLKSFGFKKNNRDYFYSAKIMNGDFTLNIKILSDGEMQTELIENAMDDVYTLHLVEGLEGNFVGQVRNEYNSVLKEIKEKCYDIDVFNWNFTKQLIDCITEKYGDNPEYLWEKFPNNAVFRRSDNKKWYAAILSVKYSKLGFESDEVAEVIDLRAEKEKVEELLKLPNIHPAYHMNKKSWITIILDGSMDLDEVMKYIDESYNLAKKH